MPDFDSDIEQLLINRQESLDVEFKCWIDPSQPANIAKIAKACIALRNNNGGRLIIGIHDDGNFDRENIPSNMKDIFHKDVIQSIVSKHSSDLFEIAVDYYEKHGDSLVVISVPNGVKVPAACKSEISDNGVKLLKTDTVYVRTLQTNNTVSSSAIRWNDWNSVVQNCFDNREADIGAFIRRHLSGLDLESLGINLNRKADLTDQEKAFEFMDYCFSRYEAIQNKRNVKLPAQLGTREISALIIGEFPGVGLKNHELFLLESKAPKLTGWSPWVVLQSRAPEDMQPYFFEGGWEAFICGETMGPHLDFWRIEGKGRFYHLRALQDDAKALNKDNAFSSRFPEPYTSVDFFLQISRTAEALATLFSFAKNMGTNLDNCSLSIAMRWKNIEGRWLTSWVDPSRSLRSSGQSHQNEVTSETIIPLNTPLNAITPFVEQLVNPVFELFDGRQFDTSVVEGIVNKTIERRL